MGGRRQAREQALQVLYQLDVTGGDTAEALRGFWANEPAEPDVEAFARTLVEAVQEHRARIDDLITAASTNWKIGRMSFVDRNVLRLCVGEFLGCDDVPPMVSINEAIELGKRFGTTESGAFINGILDRIARNLDLAGPK
jgi:N utilization substance protein B